MSCGAANNLTVTGHALSELIPRSSACGLERMPWEGATSHFFLQFIRHQEMKLELGKVERNTSSDKKKQSCISLQESAQHTYLCFQERAFCFVVIYIFKPSLVASTAHPATAFDGFAWSSYPHPHSWDGYKNHCFSCIPD